MLIMRKITSLLYYNHKIKRISYTQVRTDADQATKKSLYSLILWDRW